MASEEGRIDPMHQFEVQSMADLFTLGDQRIAFTNSALWMVITLVVLVQTRSAVSRSRVKST